MMMMSCFEGMLARQELYATANAKNRAVVRLYVLYRTLYIMYIYSIYFCRRKEPHVMRALACVPACLCACAGASLCAHAS